MSTCVQTTSESRQFSFCGGPSKYRQTSAVLMLPLPDVVICMSMQPTLQTRYTTALARARRPVTSSRAPSPEPARTMFSPHDVVASTQNVTFAIGAADPACQSLAPSAPPKDADTRVVLRALNASGLR
jgi:hypothetical protein